MKRITTRITTTALFIMLFFVGCGGGGQDSGVGPSVSLPLTTMSGIITPPSQLDARLLGSLNMVRNTDTLVRHAFESALCRVNGYPVPNCKVEPVAATASWRVNLDNVPESEDGIYHLEISVGGLAMKAIIADTQRQNFSVDSESTAIALLVEESGKSVATVRSRFIASVGRVKSFFEKACLGGTSESLLTTASLTALVATEGDFVKNFDSLSTAAQGSYLSMSNDVNGDGKVDLLISQNIDGDRIRFVSPLTAETSMLAGVATLASYSDMRLLDDFTNKNTSASRTFDATARNLVLGLHLARGADRDTYLKLFIRRIDLVEGSFRGVEVEYEFVYATPTAVLEGSQSLTLLGRESAPGAVYATNFKKSGEPGAFFLSWLDRSRGLGSSEEGTRLVRAIDGQPELKSLSHAETCLEGGANYYSNTSAALRAIYKDRSMKVGDVFSAYFPPVRRYALFKIIQLTDTEVRVAFRLNIAENEPRF